MTVDPKSARVMNDMIAPEGSNLTLEWIASVCNNTTSRTHLSYDIQLAIILYKGGRGGFLVMTDCRGNRKRAVRENKAPSGWGAFGGLKRDCV